MKNFILVFLFVVPICLLGMFAAVTGWDSLNRWCASQFDDTDGQPESDGGSR